MKLEKLITNCQNKDKKAQKELYTLYKDVLFTLCLKYCKTLQEAEDNLQDSFIEIFKNIKKYSGKGSFEGWMKRITIYKAIDKYKNRTEVSTEVIDNILTDTLVEVNKLEIPLDEILKLIQELPNRYRLVFNLYELDDYSHNEIAKLLKISVNTSKSNLHRAKFILKNKINELNQSKIHKE